MSEPQDPNPPAKCPRMDDPPCNRISEETPRNTILVDNVPDVDAEESTPLSSPIQNLSDTCLRKVFHRIDSITDKFNVELVCKRWRDHGRSSWSNIKELHRSEDRCDDRCAQAQVPQNAHENEWSINTWKVIVSRVGPSATFAALCLHVRKDIEYLIPVVENCRHLKVIELKYTNVIHLEDSREFWRPLVGRILSNNRDLERIRFYAHAEAVDFNFAVHISDRVKAIEQFSIWNGPGYWPPTIALSRFRNLRVLVLTKFSLNNCCSSAAHHWFDAVVNLERLALIDCSIPEWLLCGILRNNERLKHLDLTVDKISEALLRDMEGLSSLQVLVIDFAGATPDFLGRVTPRLKGLATDSMALTDEMLLTFFHSASAIEVLRASNARITLQSAVYAKAWTERRGKPLRLVVSKFFDLKYPDHKALHTENFQVVIDQSKIYTSILGSWGLELLQ